MNKLCAFFIACLFSMGMQALETHSVATQPQQQDQSWSNWGRQKLYNAIKSFPEIADSLDNWKNKKIVSAITYWPEMYIGLSAVSISVLMSLSLDEVLNLLRDLSNPRQGFRLFKMIAYVYGAQIASELLNLSMYMRDIKNYK